jgi:hypothetical protein
MVNMASPARRDFSPVAGRGYFFSSVSSIKHNQSDCEADEREEKQANGCQDIEHIHNCMQSTASIMPNTLR